VQVDGETVGEIGSPGLCVLVGVTHTDTSETARRLAEKLWTLRILADERSCADLGAPLLLVSQFTLYGDARKGRRPSWTAAAPGPVAEPLFDEVVTGVFGADMKVRLVNDGPFTVLLEI